MNIQSLIGGLSAAQTAGRQFADEERAAETQARTLERMRAADALSVRNEQYRQGLMQPVEGPEALPGGTPGAMAPAFPSPTQATSAAPAAPAAGPSAFMRPAAPDQSTAEAVRLSKAGTPGTAPYENVAGYTPPAGMTGPQNMAALRDARMQRFANPQGAAATATMTEAQRLAELQRLNTGSTAPTAPAANAPRGVRNNNPGNIIASPFATRMGAVGADAQGFAIFPDAAAGERAAVGLLSVYGQQGLNTVEQIVGKWSPANAPGNTPAGTASYVNFVAKQLGVAPNTPLNMQDPQVLQRIAATKFQFENGGYTPGAAPTPAQAAAPTQAAAPAAAPAIPEVQFTPEQVTQLSARAQQESRMAQLRLQELNRMLPMAPTAEVASKIREEANKVRFGGYSAQLVDASAQAIGGNQQALSQLATAARVQYAQTPQGFVEVALDPATSQYKAVSQPMPLNTFVNQLYAVASGAAAKAEQARREAMLKTQGEIAVEQVKGLNKLREVSATAEKDLQKALFERQLSANDVAKIDTVGGLGKEQVLVTMKNGQIAVLQPAQDLGGGMMSQPRLQPIQ